MEKIQQLQKLKNITDRKLIGITHDTRFTTPGDGLSSAQQAGWLIHLLAKTYVSHGISKMPEEVKSSIENGQSRCWFALHKDEPLASSVLVRQQDGAVELGRAVSLEPGSGLGGILMLMAAISHLSSNDNPLIAEVRVADEFAGVPGGIATQKICHGHIGLLPHALIPAFHHGIPDRQEQFVFSSSAPFGESEDLCIPNDKNTLGLLAISVLPLIHARFSPEIKSHKSSMMGESGWTIVQSAPFSVVVPTRDSTSLETTIVESEKLNPFTLIPVETTSANVGNILACLNNGFIPCGIDRKVGEKGHPILLLGKLRRGTLLAPTHILDNVLEPQEIKALRQIDHQFRQTL